MSTTWDSVVDEVWGPAGTPKRDRIDRATERHLKADRILARALRPAHALRVTRPFATSVWWLSESIGSGRPTLRGLADLLAFEYLGDFLFWGRPMTEPFAGSRLDRMHLPRWLRLRR